MIEQFSKEFTEKMEKEIKDKFMDAIGLQIKIKYIKDIEPLEIIGQGDMIDLRCAEDTELKKGDYKIIPLGIAVQLPDGYYAEILPRSSTFGKYKILMANSMGVIDHTYMGDSDEWGYVAYAVEDTFIPKNTRIAQFRIVECMPKVSLLTVEHLNNPSRGGFGSTGN